VKDTINSHIEFWPSPCALTKYCLNQMTNEMVVNFLMSYSKEETVIHNVSQLITTKVPRRIRLTVKKTT